MKSKNENKLQYDTLAEVLAQFKEEKGFSLKKIFTKQLTGILSYFSELCLLLMRAISSNNGKPREA